MNKPKTISFAKSRPLRFSGCVIPLLRRRDRVAGEDAAVETLRMSGIGLLSSHNVDDGAGEIGGNTMRGFTARRKINSRNRVDFLACLSKPGRSVRRIRRCARHCMYRRPVTVAQRVAR